MERLMEMKGGESDKRRDEEGKEGKRREEEGIEDGREGKEEGKKEKGKKGQRKGEKRTRSKVQLDWTGSNSGLISCGGNNAKVTDLLY
jgi:predicted ribosome quality control (RQC) complex YloA/Tae2 family protein